MARKYRTPYIIRATVAVCIGVVTAGVGEWIMPTADKWRGSAHDVMAKVWAWGAFGLSWSAVIVGFALIVVVVGNTLYLYGTFRRAAMPKVVRDRRHHYVSGVTVPRYGIYSNPGAVVDLSQG
jgi:hypothetical protein